MEGKRGDDASIKCDPIIIIPKGREAPARKVIRAKRAQRRRLPRLQPPVFVAERFWVEISIINWAVVADDRDQYAEIARDLKIRLGDQLQSFLDCYGGFLQNMIAMLEYYHVFEDCGVVDPQRKKEIASFAIAMGHEVYLNMLDDMLQYKELINGDAIISFHTIIESIQI
jgi:hypothetical protein